ncbi:MAG: 3-methylcrotonyl-CoA carboxylase alpha subunit [Gammaproteobacteria bacterium]|jgi:3-methylcrotonyl-CoA carboxylase alpha subunit
MINTLLIANRGEIACRIILTAQRMGIRTIAVYSDADAQARHVRLADHAVHIGPSPAAQSYLRGEAIIEAAVRAEADAIHPGYGFLSENAQFARDCAQASLCFVGPSANAIEAMGSKRAALELMAGHGVPILAGYRGVAQDDAALLDAAQTIGFPLMVKPSAGGGGKGMQIVHDSKALEDVLPATRRVAKASFGDDTLLLERYLASARHIEIQVFADDHGNCVHLYERDCSVQRRHQKIVEEAPAADFPAQVRERMAAVAIRAARAIDYRGAGTVEFLYDPAHRQHAALSDSDDGDHECFYFMEMNTRLQVEHPVTEMVTGVDLVEWQLQVAAGNPLPLRQDQIQLNGHAIEARVYAEDPRRDFLPATGRVQWMRINDGNGVRVDSGIDIGDSISPHYDPMIAKLIVHNTSRATTINRLRMTLNSTDLGPLPNNIGFLRALAADPAWSHRAQDTSFIAQAGETLNERQLSRLECVLAASAWLMTANTDETTAAATNPWLRVRGFRINQSAQERHRLLVANELIDCIVERHVDRCELRFEFETSDDESADQGDTGPYVLRAPRRNGDSVMFDFDGQRRCVRVHVTGSDLHLDNGHARAIISVLDNATPAQAGQLQGAGQLLSPMPGRVVSIDIATGDRVEARQALAVIEAMKMEHTLTAPGPGLVTAVNCHAGAQVEEGVVLIAIELD